ncbi:MAG: TetR/AcrR family transcriptional regulator [Eubacterium sp.]
MKKSEKTEITREKIIKASCEQFGLYGFDGATINQICRQYNISKGLIYYNFESKEELYVCCVNTAVNAFISHMQKKNFQNDFNKYMQERCLFFKNHPDYSRLIFSIILTDNSEFSEKVREIKERFDEFNRGVYSRTIDTLKLRDGISKTDALEYYGLLQNMLNNYLSTAELTDKTIDLAVSGHEKTLETILDYMLYGIAEEKK